MTTKKDAEKTDGVTQPKISWNDDDMKSLYANVSNVTGGREEIILLFGMNQSWHPKQKEVKIDLAERVVLSPYAAKRLALLLNKTILEYESRFGELEIGLKEVKK